VFRDIPPGPIKKDNITRPIIGFDELSFVLEVFHKVGAIRHFFPVVEKGGSPGFLKYPPYPYTAPRISLSAYLAPVILGIIFNFVAPRRGFFDTYF
jgi:hypothetical protein